MRAARMPKRVLALLLPLVAIPLLAQGAEDATAAAPTEVQAARVSLSFLFLGAQDHRLLVRKRYQVERASARAATGAKELVEVYVPEGRIGEATAIVTSGEVQQAFSLARRDPGAGYRVSCPILPGRASVDVKYEMPYNSEGQSYEEVVLYSQEGFQVFVLPASLGVTSENLVAMGRDSQTGLSRYQTTASWRYIPTATRRDNRRREAISPGPGTAYMYRNSTAWTRCLPLQPPPARHGTSP